MRAPIRRIIGLERIAASHSLEVEVLEVLAKMRQTAFDMDSMLMKLQKAHAMNVHRGQTKLTHIDMPGLVNELINDFQLAIAPVSINVSIDIQQASLFSNPTLVSLIIFNLLENSFKFRSSEFPKVTVYGRLLNTRYWITVEDNGIGISPKFQAQIFDAFFKGSTRYSGAGLGLYLVKKAVFNLGGEIKMSSQTGNGASFTVCLPYLGFK